MERQDLHGPKANDGCEAQCFCGILTSQGTTVPFKLPYLALVSSNANQ